VEVLVEGKVEKFAGFLALRVPGLDRPFVLEGGTKVGDLEARPDMVGTRVAVTGLLQPVHGDKPPRLTVEKID
jgi:hypothetical protein